MKRAEAVKLIKDYGFAVLKHQNNWLGEAYEALLSALLAASAPTPSVEPVAWAVFSTNGYAKYVTTDKDEADKWIKDWSDVRPLYAAPLANPSDKQEAVKCDTCAAVGTVASINARCTLCGMRNAAPIAQSAEQDRIDAERFPYQQTFDAIAFATKIEGGGIAISVEKFRKAFGTLAKGANK